MRDRAVNSYAGRRHYFTEAVNSLKASRWTLLWARLFGTRCDAFDGENTIRLARWRGVTYML